MPRLCRPFRFHEVRASVNISISTTMEALPRSRSGCRSSSRGVYNTRRLHLGARLLGAGSVRRATLPTGTISGLTPVRPLGSLQGGPDRTVSDRFLRQARRLAYLNNDLRECLHFPRFLALSHIVYRPPKRACKSGRTVYVFVTKQPFLNCCALEKSGGVFAPSTLTPSR